MIVMVFKCKLNIFFLISNYGKKLIWIFDFMLVFREIMRFLGWNNGFLLRFLVLGNCLIFVFSGCSFEVVVIERF